MKILRFLCVAAVLFLVCTPAQAEIDSSRAAYSRSKNLRLAARYLEIAINKLRENATIAPDIVIALSDARDGLQDLADDVDDIHKQANAPWEFIKTAFPWTAPFIAAGGAFAGGVKRGVHIERKRTGYVPAQALPPAGRAPGGSATPFTDRGERRPTPQAHPIPVEPSMSEVEGMRDMSTASFEDSMRPQKKA